MPKKNIKLYNNAGGVIAVWPDAIVWSTGENTISFTSREGKNVTVFGGIIIAETVSTNDGFTEDEP